MTFMDRRDFIKGLIAAAIAPAFLPGAGRIWRPERVIVKPSPCKTLVDYLLTRHRHMEQLIVTQTNIESPYLNEVASAKFPPGVVNWRETIGLDTSGPPEEGAYRIARSSFLRQVDTPDMASEGASSLVEAVIRSSPKALATEIEVLRGPGAVQEIFQSPDDHH